MKKRTLLLGCVIVVIVAFLEGIYAIQLKNIYYSQFAPFFDSVDYHNQMAVVIETVRKRGFWEGLTKNASTVFLPFFEGALLGIFMRPSRGIGIWLQVLWLAVLGASVFYYFYRFYIKKLAPALALTLPFMGIAALWQFNGGLSDFRMDLHLYLLFSITLIWFLMTRYTSQLYPWIFTGLFAGLACLSRATAPVYLGVALVPILVVRLIQTKKQARLQLLKRISIMVAIASLIAGWFYVTAFKTLYFYYVVWNLDANAKLPFQQSVQHLGFAISSMGWFPPVLAAMLLPFTITPFLREKHLIKIARNFDWEALWIGVAPVAFLVLRGAGLNSFVSMPAAFGFVLFLLKPFTAELNPLRPFLLPSRGLLILVMSISLMILSAFSGIRNHLHPAQEMGRMDGHQQIIHTMLQDGLTRKDLEVSFAIPYTGYLNSSSIWNVFVYDTTMRPKSVNGGIFNRLANDNYFPIATLADWENIPGKTDQQKIDHLIMQVQSRADYLILLTNKSLDFFEKNMTGVFINKFSRVIVQQLLNSQWEPLGKPIQITSVEEVQIYRKYSSK